MKEKLEELYNMRELYKSDLIKIERIKSDIKDIIFITEEQQEKINNILNELTNNIEDLKKDIKKQLDSFII